MSKEHVLRKLKEADGYLSGQDLARDLDLSRNSIWKIMGKLKDEGYEIESQTNLGYKLLAVTDRLSKEEIQEAYPKIGNRLVVFESLDSTNDYAKTHQDKLADETIILTDHQTAGRGRYGRSFHSPKGTGLYFSYFFRGEHMPRPEFLTLAAAVAMRRALVGISLDPQIKWVNDIYLGDRKVAGILTEGEISLENLDMKYLVLGIGLNVNTDRFPEDLEGIAVSLKQAAGKSFDINQVAARVFQSLDEVLTGLRKSPEDPDYHAYSQALIQEFNDHLYLKGRQVELVGGNQAARQGRLLGVDEKGQIIIDTPEGPFSANYGEYSIKKG